MRQRLGQHFLKDDNVVQTILAAAELTATDQALEIGPGKGVLTKPLVSRVARLVAVELDNQLAPALAPRLGRPANLDLHHKDFLKVDLTELFPVGITPKILGNLPYAITAPILEKVCAWPRWNQAVFLVQNEVADRLAADPHSKAYGLLSLAIQIYATVELIMTVPPSAFVPPPEVTSQVIRLRRLPQPQVRADRVPAFFAVARAAFQHRRKSVENALGYAFSQPKNEITQALIAAGIDPGSRAEDIPLSGYIKLSENSAFTVEKIEDTKN